MIYRICGLHPPGIMELCAPFSMVPFVVLMFFFPKQLSVFSIARKQMLANIYACRMITLWPHMIWPSGETIIWVCSTNFFDAFIRERCHFCISAAATAANTVSGSWFGGMHIPGHGLYLGGLSKGPSFALSQDPQCFHIDVAAAAIKILPLPLSPALPKAFALFSFLFLFLFVHTQYCLLEIKFKSVVCKTNALQDVLLLQFYLQFWRGTNPLGSGFTPRFMFRNYTQKAQGREIGCLGTNPGQLRKKASALSAVLSLRAKFFIFLNIS